mgnify:CR=1 FL=1
MAARMRAMGDFSLYIAGFFSDSLKRKLVDVDYYIGMGGAAYENAARLEDKKHRAQVLLELSKKYSGAKWIWAQEEPQNMGAWSFIKLHTEDLMELSYAGRKPNASPATGSPKMHAAELESLLQDALK